MTNGLTPVARRSLLLLGALALALVALAAASARSYAAPKTCDTDCPPPGGSTYYGFVKLTVGSHGGVSGDGLAVTCTSANSPCTVEWTSDGAADTTTATYTASPDQGFAPQWTGCTTASGNTCTVTVSFGSSSTGNSTNTQSVGLTFRDVAAPTVSISGPTAGARIGGMQAWSASASDNTGVARVVWTVTNETTHSTYWTYQANTGPYWWLDWDTTSVADGPYTIAAVAYDTAGNASSKVSRSYTVDNTIDHITFDTPAAGGWVNSSPVWSWHGVDPDVASVTCELDGTGSGPFYPCASNTSWQPDLSGDGQHTVYVKLVDQAGNTVTDSRTVTLDTVAPTATFDQPDDWTTTSTSPTFTFHADGTPSADPTTATCALDGGSATDCSSGSYSPGAVGYGSHTVIVRVTDGAGNVATYTRHFTVPAPPAAAGSGGGSNGGGSNAGSGGGGGFGTQSSSLPKLSAAIVLGAKKGRVTRFTRLRVVGAPAGARVALICHGRGCRFKSRSASAGGTLDLTRLVKSLRLRPGAYLELKITAPGYAPLDVRFTARRGRAPVRRVL